MNNAQIASVPQEPAAKLSYSFTNRSAFLVAACACLFLMVSNVVYRESYSGDEGFYGVTAMNMLRSADYIIRPSYYPAGDFLKEKDAYAHPPFNSYLYALSLWFSRGARAGPELVNVLSFALLLYFAYRVMSRFDEKAGRFTILLLAASPAILVSYSQLEAEPLMTTSGIMALYCALRAGIERGQRRWLFFGGLCLGLAFALKLWLCGPLALAVAAALVMRARQSGGALRQKLAALLLFGAGAAIPAGSHLLAIGLTHPGDLGFWLKNIYFGVFTSAGISGSKLAGAGTPTDWVHPVWYYGAALYRDHFFLLPVIVLGFGSALRDARGKSDLLWIIAAGIFGLAPLSLMKVKEPLYVLSCVLFIYLLAGLCLAALARRIASGEDIDSLSARIGMLVLPGLLLLFPLAYAKGVQPDKITRGFVVAHSVTFTLFIAAFLWSRHKKSARIFEWSVYGVCAIAVLGAFGYHFVTQRPRDKFITRITRPYWEANSPDALSLIASNFKSYQFYSYRRGCYWHELPLQERPELLLSQPGFSTVRAFILDPEEQKKPEIAPWLAWLQAHAVEKTAELNDKLGHASGFRVFIREAGNRPGG